MDKSKNKSATKTKNFTVVDEPNINNLVGAKRGKKKSVADEFADITVPTTSIEQNLPKKTTKVASKKQVEDNSSEEQLYTKNGYTRPDVTFTDQLSKEQIQEKLEDYKKVDDMFKVPLGVHIRYFSNINGKMVFRMGGQLHNNTGLPEYVILNSGKVQWSVQVKNTTFYRKMTLTEIKNEYQNIIEDLVQKNKKLKDENKKLTEKINEKSVKK